MQYTDGRISCGRCSECEGSCRWAEQRWVGSSSTRIVPSLHAHATSIPQSPLTIIRVRFVKVYMRAFLAETHFLEGFVPGLRTLHPHLWTFSCRLSVAAWQNGKAEGN